MGLVFRFLLMETVLLLLLNYYPYTGTTNYSYNSLLLLPSTPTACALTVTLLNYYYLLFTVTLLNYY